MKLKIFNLSLAVSSMVLCMVSCGQKASDTAINLLQQTDTEAKTNVQKARDQCYAGLDPIAVSKDGVGKVKICTEQKATDKTDRVFKILTGDRMYKLDHLAGNKLSIAVSASVKFDNSTLAAAVQTQLVQQITDECLPNLKTFWNKHNISMDLSFTPYNELAQTDQILSLNTTKDTSKGADASKVLGLRISEWPESSEFAASITKECQDEMDKATDKTKTQQNNIGQNCLRMQNQKFCLALNKMLGHWVGAVDLDDPGCTSIERPVVASDSANQSPEDSLRSFMSFPIIDSAVPALTEIPVPAPTTPAAPATKDIETAPTDPAPPTAVSSLETLATDYDPSNIPVKTNPAPVPESKTSGAQDTSADPSYQPWLAYKISSDNLKSMFNCDPTAPIKNIAAPKTSPVKKSVAPVKPAAASAKK